MSLFNESTGKFNIEALRKLSTFDLNHTYNIFGYTPLIQAIITNNSPLITELLKRGVDPNGPRKQLLGDADYRLYPIEYTSDMKLIELLIKNGAKICRPDVVERKWPFMVTVQSLSDARRLIRWCKQQKIDINTKNNLGRNIMFQSIEMDDDAITHLVDNGCDIDCEDNAGDTPLMLAVKDGNAKWVDVLLKNDANRRYKNKNGKCAQDIFDILFELNMNVAVAAVFEKYDDFEDEMLARQW